MCTACPLHPAVQAKATSAPAKAPLDPVLFKKWFGNPWRPDGTKYSFEQWAKVSACSIWS